MTTVQWLGSRGAGEKLNQFAIRNSQFAITFCDGDFTPTQNVLPVEAGELNPKTLLNIR